MPFKTTLGGKMVFDTRPKVESANGRPGHGSLARFHSDPVLPPAPLPAKPSSSTSQEHKEDVEGYLEECTPGSGHCAPPIKDEVGEETVAASAGSDTATPESASEGSDDETNSLSDFFCKTAASIERSWDAVKRAKQERPNWMRWWSF